MLSNSEDILVAEIMLETKAMIEAKRKVILPLGNTIPYEDTRRSISIEFECID